MRALTRGERRASLGVVLGLVGVLCLLVASLGLAAWGIQQQAATRSTIYERCLQRATYDASNHDAVVANVELYGTLVAIAEQQVIPPGTPPETVRLYDQQVEALRTAMAKASEAAGRGVIANCNAYK